MIFTNYIPNNEQRCRHNKMFCHLHERYRSLVRFCCCQYCNDCYGVNKARVMFFPSLSLSCDTSLVLLEQSADVKLKKDVSLQSSFLCCSRQSCPCKCAFKRLVCLPHRDLRDISSVSSRAAHAKYSHLLFIPMSF